MIVARERLACFGNRLFNKSITGTTVLRKPGICLGNRQYHQLCSMPISTRKRLQLISLQRLDGDPVNAMYEQLCVPT